MKGALFVHPEWLVAIAAIAFTALVGVAAARVRQRERRRALGAHARASVSLARDGALLAALFATGLALLGPRLGETHIRVPGTGADVVFLLDVSRSMTAQDVAPSRLGAAQAAARNVLARLTPNDRAALAIFAGRGVLLAPLTPDFEALGELIAALDTQLIEPSGSRLAAGVSAALAAFEVGSERSRSLVLLSDGEDPRATGTLGTAAAQAAGVQVIAVGFGSDAGANLPDLNGEFRDADGNLVVSRRDLRRLRLLAEATGGAVLGSDASGAFDAQAAQRSIRASAGASDGAWVERRVPNVRVEWFVWLAIALLVGEAGVRPRARRRAASLALATACVWLVAAAPSGTPEPAREPHSDPREHSSDAAELIAFGLDRVEALDYLAGLRALQAAALTTRDPALGALAWYDLGVAALQAGDLERARDAFFDSLALAPLDREARFNLEWTLNALSNQPAPLELPPPPATPSRAQTPPPDAEPEEQSAETGASAAPLSAAEQRRLLLQVDDDLRRALLSATQADAPKSRRTRPAW